MEEVEAATRLRQDERFIVVGCCGPIRTQSATLLWKQEQEENTCAPPNHGWTNRPSWKCDRLIESECSSFGFPADDVDGEPSVPARAAAEMKTIRRDVTDTEPSALSPALESPTSVVELTMGCTMAWTPATTRNVFSSGRGTGVGGVPGRSIAQLSAMLA